MSGRTLTREEAIEASAKYVQPPGIRPGMLVKFWRAGEYLASGGPSRPRAAVIEKVHGTRMVSVQVLGRGLQQSQFEGVRHVGDPIGANIDPYAGWWDFTDEHNAVQTLLDRVAALEAKGSK